MNEINKPPSDIRTLALTVISSISGALTILMLTFLWNMQANFATLVERDKNRSDFINSLQTQVNKNSLRDEDLELRAVKDEGLILALQTELDELKPKK